jgi:hypothetical protein
MKKTRAGKNRERAEDKVLKPRRGRPKLTDAEKAADPRRIMMGEIKSDLKKVKKSKKRLGLLLEKAQAEQGILMAALLDSLEKLKIELKKKPRKAKKAKTGKRGRPSAIKKPVAKKRRGRKSAKKTIAKKTKKKTVVRKPTKKLVMKPRTAKKESVKPVSRPTKKQIKKIAPTPIEKTETTEVSSAPANPGVSETEPKKD